MEYRSRPVLLCSHDSCHLANMVKTDVKFIFPPSLRFVGTYKRLHNGYTQRTKGGIKDLRSNLRTRETLEQTKRRALITCASVVILSMFKGYGWSDKSPVGFTRWNPQQPDSHHGQQPCVEMYSTGEWGDTGCYSVKKFVCKMPRCKLIDRVSVDKTNKQIKQTERNVEYHTPLPPLPSAKNINNKKMEKQAQKNKKGGGGGCFSSHSCVLLLVLHFTLTV